MEEPGKQRTVKPLKSEDECHESPPFRSLGTSQKREAIRHNLHTFSLSLIFALSDQHNFE